MSNTISQLRVDQVFVLRWMDAPLNAKLADDTASWSSGWGRNKKTLSYECHGQVKLCAAKNFSAELSAQISEHPHYNLRTSSAGGSFWKLHLDLKGVLATLSNPNRKYFLLGEVTYFKGLEDLQTKDFLLVADLEADVIPLCLHGDFIEQPAEIVEHKVLGTGLKECPYSKSFPSPGYWPVTRVFVRKKLLALAGAIQYAIENSKTNLCGFETETASLVQVDKSEISTFLRDYWVNVCHAYPRIQDTESLSTTKNDGQGWGDTTSIINPTLSHVGESFRSSGFGFGGNFLTCEVEGKPYLFYGGCTHQVGQYADDSFMIQNILGQMRKSITTVKLDTGWLMVGHVDEIISFPRAGVALIASPKVYREIYKNTELEDQELNQLIETKLLLIGQTLGKIGCDILPIPVWFKPKSGEPAHVTTVRGSAVNCIYVGEFSIHSQSGLSGVGFEGGGNLAPQSLVDAYVARTMKSLGYMSLFVNMKVANDENDAGGNVHCATYTIHLPPPETDL